MTSLIDAESVLAVDIGTRNTRALLFDVVEGQYHFIAAAVAPSTAAAPFRDVNEGVLLALQRLQEITGRTLTGRDARLAIPTQPDGTGIDRLALTCSAGPDWKVIPMGLLGDVSLASAQHLAESSYTRVVETIGMNDRRRFDGQFDAVLAAQPEILILAGGTEDGASRSVFKLAELIFALNRVLPAGSRPRVLYCGNSALAKSVQDGLGKDTHVETAPNIRPSVDLEDLGPAQAVLANMVSDLQMTHLGGLHDLASRAGASPLPSAFAFGRMMRFSSRLSTLSKPTLGIDVGASGVTLARAEDGNLALSVLRQPPLAPGLPSLLANVALEDIARWIPMEITTEDLQDALLQRQLYPASIPMTDEALAIEQALVRENLRLAAARLAERWPDTPLSFERIFLSGAVLAQAPTPAQALLMLLDGLQPVGINMVLLDPHGLSQALGAIAGSNTLLPAQILDSGVYSNLGTVLCPVSDARPGAKILQVRIRYEDRSQTSVEVKQGALVVLPVRNRQVVNLEIETANGTLLDPCLPRMLRFKAVGGLCGVVVDARGRSIRLPKNAARRSEALRQWNAALVEQRPGGE